MPRRAPSRKDTNSHGPFPGFLENEQVLYRYWKKERSAVVPAIVVHRVFQSCVGCSSHTDIRLFVASYVIRSEFGGEMIVPADQLRPGNALDRISVALEDDTGGAPTETTRPGRARGRTKLTNGRPRLQPEVG